MVLGSSGNEVATTSYATQRKVRELLDRTATHLSWTLEDGSDSHRWLSNYEQFV
jgi:hypothetical protein